MGLNTSQFFRTKLQLELELCYCYVCLKLYFFLEYFFLFLSTYQSFQIQSYKMSDDSSSDELQIEKVQSQKGSPKFGVVPKDIKFMIKFKNTAGKAYSLMEYDLIKGKKLPYIAFIKGKN